MRITENLIIDEKNLKEDFIRSSGPGGQNVNKVSTAVQLRFDVNTLPGDVRQRLVRIAGKRINGSGELVINACRFRTRERNREDARERLKGLLAEASVRPVRRVATRPTRASVKRRIESKKKRSEKKRARGRFTE